MEENEERVHYLFIDAFLDYVDAETTGEFEDVIRQLNEIIYLNDYYFQAWQLKARILNKLERHGEALAAWNNSIELEKDHYFQAYEDDEGEYPSEINRMVTYSRLGADEQALALCEKFLENHPDDLLAFENRVIFTFNLKNYKKVIELCEELEKQFPSVRVWVNHGWLRKQRISANIRNIYATSLYFEKRFEESESVMKETLESYPNDTECLQMMSQLLFERENPRDAFEYINKVSEIDPTDAELWVQKAEILVALGNIEETLDCLLIATSLKPEIKSSIRDNEAFLPLSENDRYRKIISESKNI